MNKDYWWIKLKSLFSLQEQQYNTVCLNCKKSLREHHRIVSNNGEYYIFPCYKGKMTTLFNPIKRKKVSKITLAQFLEE